MKGGKGDLNPPFRVKSAEVARKWPTKIFIKSTLDRVGHLRTCFVINHVVVLTQTHRYIEYNMKTCYIYTIIYMYIYIYRLSWVASGYNMI